MKHLLISAVAYIMVFAAPSSGLLEKMQEKIASMGCVSITVTIQDTDASVVTDGVRYVMKSDVMDVWSDGTDQWIYNHSTKEMTVTKADPGSVDIFENPASVLTSKILDAYAVVSEQNGTVLLKARKNVRVSYPEISIKAAPDCLPRDISLKSSAGDIYDMKILSVKAVLNPSPDTFTPSEDILGKSFINDMR